MCRVRMIVAEPQCIVSDGQKTFESTAVVRPVGIGNQRSPLQIGQRQHNDPAICCRNLANNGRGCWPRSVEGSADWLAAVALPHVSG